jgi:arylsulfatase A-like enzyme/Tfp pilus assembly protein PilF
LLCRGRSKEDPLNRPLLYLWLIIAIGCGGRQENPTDPLLNVILISIDTLRADHLGCYGYPQATTPNIDRFAERSTLFERCQSAVPITLPSHTTMLTGMYPIRHSVRDNGTFTVPNHLPTLPTILTAWGYTTLAAIGSFPLTSRFGLNRGFDVYDEELGSGEDSILGLFFDERKADKVTEAAIRLLDTHSTEPFFLFAHYFDPHHPWDPPSQYLRQHPELPYDAEISYVDTWVGRLLDELEARGLMESSIVVLTADHGEGLDHSREFTHSFLLYQGTLHVPLLISIPGREGARIDRFVSLADITPTVLEALEIEIEHAIDGQSLFGPVNDDRIIYMETLAGRLERGWNDLRAIVMDRHKLILGSPSELYDLEEDPGETRDLSMMEPDRAAAMEDTLRTFIAHSPATHSLAASYKVADPEVESRLRALGYLTGDSSDLSLEELGEISPEHDPGPLVQLIWVQSIARGLINEGEFHQAITLLEDTLARVGEDPDYSQHLTLAYTLAGDYEKAMPLIDNLLSDRSPNDVSPFVMASVAQAGMGHIDVALDWIDEALAIVPDTTLKIRKAAFLKQLGREDEAIGIFESTLLDEPCEQSVLQELARIRRLADDRNRARVLYEKMIECRPYDPRAMYNMGSMCLEDGDTVAAKRWFDDAVATDPRYAAGHYGIALVHLQTGDRERAILSLQEAIAVATTESPISRKAAQLLSTLERDGRRNN